MTRKGELDVQTNLYTLLGMLCLSGTVLGVISWCIFAPIISVDLIAWPGHFVGALTLPHLAWHWSVFPHLRSRAQMVCTESHQKYKRILQEHLCHQPRSYSGRISSIIFLYEHSMDIYILCLTGSVVASDTAAWGKSDVWHCDAWRRTSTTAVAGLCRRVL